MIEWVECEFCFALIDAKVNHLCRSVLQSTSFKKGSCFYCGFRERLTREHVIPQALGRQYRSPWNCVKACSFCNQKKGAKLLAKWLSEIQSYASHHPKYEAIVIRTPAIVAELFNRPEFGKYRGWIDPTTLSSDGWIGSEYSPRRYNEVLD